MGKKVKDGGVCAVSINAREQTVAEKYAEMRVAIEHALLGSPRSRDLERVLLMLVDDAESAEGMMRNHGALIEQLIVADDEKVEEEVEDDSIFDLPDDPSELPIVWCGLAERHPPHDIYAPHSFPRGPVPSAFACPGWHPITQRLLAEAEQGRYLANVCRAMAATLGENRPHAVALVVTAIRQYDASMFG